MRWGFSTSLTSSLLLFAFGGGALFHNGSRETVEIDHSTFAYNEVAPDAETEVALGGGIAGVELFGMLVSDSTISGNASSKYGGGIGLYEAELSLVRNTTISGNEAAVNGGGVHLMDQDKYARFENSTITDNDAWATANGSSGYGGGIYAIEDPNSEEPFTGRALEHDRRREPRSLRRVAGPRRGQRRRLRARPHDRRRARRRLRVDRRQRQQPDRRRWRRSPIDPLIAPIADNGGPTKTHLPLAGSPALDAGISNGLTTDQRGVARTFDIPEIANVSDGTDIGSVEIQGEPPAPAGPDRDL